jgi:hypothetical protein
VYEGAETIARIKRASFLKASAKSIYQREKIGHRREN